MKHSYKSIIVLIFLLMIFLFGCLGVLYCYHTPIKECDSSISHFFGTQPIIIQSSNTPCGYQISILKTEDLCIWRFQKGDSIDRYIALSELPKGIRNLVTDSSAGILTMELDIPVLEQLEDDLFSYFFMDVNFDGEYEFIASLPGYNRTYYACYNLADNNEVNPNTGLMESMRDEPFNCFVGGDAGKTIYDYQKKTICICEEFGCLERSEKWYTIVYDSVNQIEHIKMVKYENVDYRENVSHSNDEICSVSSDDGMKISQLHAINDSLYQEIVTSLSQPLLLTLLKREKVLTDSLLTAKLDFSKLYMSGLGEDYTTMALSDIETEFLNNRNDNLKDFLYSLNDANYAPNRSFLPIPQSQFNKTYVCFKSNLSLHSKLSNVLNQTEIKLGTERKLWNGLMQLRSDISNLLQGSQKQVFDNATYRLQWYQLIQLKNEYMGYGMLEREVDDCILHDTCGYQEVMDYKGFTIVSEKYYQNRFGSSYIKKL